MCTLQRVAPRSTSVTRVSAVMHRKGVVNLFRDSETDIGLHVRGGFSTDTLTLRTTTGGRIQ